MRNYMNTYNTLVMIGNRLNQAFINKINVDTDKVLSLIIADTYNNGQNSLKMIGNVFTANNIHSRTFCLKVLARVPKTNAVSNAINTLNGELSNMKFVYGDRNVLRAVTMADVGRLLHAMINTFAPTANSQSSSSNSIQLTNFQIKKEPSDIALARKSVKELDLDKSKKTATADRQ